MLAKNQRLDRKLFTQYFKTGRRYNSQFCSIISSSDKKPRCAVVVSKKTARLAHERNLIKRRIYAIVYKLWQENGAPGVLIIITKPLLKTLSKKQFNITVTAEIVRALYNG